MLDGRVSGIGVLATRRYAMFGGALCIYPPSASPYRRGLATPLRVARPAALRCRPLSLWACIGLWACVVGGLASIAGRIGGSGFTASEVTHNPHIRTGLRFSGERTRIRCRAARVRKYRERRIRAVAHIGDGCIEERALAEVIGGAKRIERGVS